MSHDKFEAMKEAHEALIAALDSNDIAAIEAAVSSFGERAQALRSVVDSCGPEAAEHAAELRRLSQHARMRVNFLTDAVSRRLERLEAVRGRGQVSLYAR